MSAAFILFAGAECENKPPPLCSFRTIKPELIINAFKSNATRALREQNLVGTDIKIRSFGKSRRYLWKPRSVALAIDYTLNQQGENLIEFDTWLEMNGESLDE